MFSFVVVRLFCVYFCTSISSNLRTASSGIGYGTFLPQERGFLAPVAFKGSLTHNPPKRAQLWRAPVPTDPCHLYVNLWSGPKVIGIQ